MLDISSPDNTTQFAGWIAGRDPLLDRKTTDGTDRLTNPASHIQCTSCFNSTGGSYNYLRHDLIYRKMTQIFKNIVFQTFPYPYDMARAPRSLVMFPPQVGHILKQIFLLGLVFLLAGFTGVTTDFKLGTDLFTLLTSMFKTYLRIDSQCQGLALSTKPVI